jgi:acetyltransferase
MQSVLEPMIQTTRCDDPGPRGLDAIFSPRSVAVIGATEREGSVGRTVLQNLLRTPFGGPVYPINPKRQSVLGVRCYPTIGDSPDVPDLAIITTPAASIPAVMQECGEAGVRGAVVISAGFQETGPEGAALERRVRETAQSFGIRMIGPNCLGIMNPLTGLNATFAASLARRGSIAFLSQSGALCTAVLDWSERNGVGFSTFISSGAMVDVGWGDLIDYFGDDPHTRSIVIYMESIGDARSFISAAREVALTKPIIVLKAGRTEAAAKAAASHTGAMTGADDALDAAFHRAGVLRVNSIAELFYMADILHKQPSPKGPRLTVITNAGGPGVLATDSLLLAGGELTTLSEEARDKLSAELPAHWSHANPIDVLGDADATRYVKALDIAAEDPNSDGLLVILTPQAMTEPTQTARQLAERARKYGKPVLASWMGGNAVADAQRLLSEAGIPTFPYPDTPARLFAYMWQHAKDLAALYETPSILPHEAELPVDPGSAQSILDSVHSEGRTLLNEWEAKSVLRAYGIPVTQTLPASSADDAVSVAQMLGYPVVLKLWSNTISHKTDVNGVRLSLHTEAAVREAFDSIRAAVAAAGKPEAFLGVTVQPMIRTRGYELILGSSVDSQLGPTMLFGTGGQMTEVLQDRSLALPPLTTTLARHMVEKTKAYRALVKPRGDKPVSLAELDGLLVRFSQLVIRHPAIAEIEINPLLASSDGLIALDARVSLSKGGDAKGGQNKPAIRPYPDQYTWKATTRSDQPIVIRPLRPEDEPLLVDFHARLSDETVYMRYFNQQKLSRRTAHSRLIRSCFLDYDRQVALAALTPGEQPALAGVARLIRKRTPGEADFAMIIADDFQGKGIGTELMQHLLDVARDEKVHRITGTILNENQRMQQLCRRFGFILEASERDCFRAVLDL